MLISTLDKIFLEKHISTLLCSNSAQAFFFFATLNQKKRSENMSNNSLFHGNDYLCSKFAMAFCLCGLTYSTLADLSARLNLVNSTFEARTSLRQVCSLFGGHRPLCLFRFKAYQSRTEETTKGFRVLPFCNWTRRKCGNPLAEANFNTNHYVSIKFPERQCSDLQFMGRFGLCRKAFRWRSKKD